MTATTINGSNWTAINEQGLVTAHNVEVHQYDDGTVSIGSSVHMASDLVITDKRIESTFAGWYLVRNG